VAQAFDFAGSTNRMGAPSFAFFAKGGQGNAYACGLIPSLRNKSYSTGIIDAHPCKKRKTQGWGTPVEMLHIKILKGGPPAKNKK
jgi:hypothetical protein